MGWIWKKGISVGKKVLAVGFLMVSAPFFVPPLVVASAIALVLSFPYCIYLASYVCTEKLMRKLLPATAFGDKTVLLIGHGDVYDDGIARFAASGPFLVQTEEDDRTPLRVANIVFDVYQSHEDMTKESKSLFRRFGDEGRNNKGILEKAFGEEDNRSGAKSENVLAGKKQMSGTRHEGERESTTTKASRVKDMEKSSNEMKVLYSEEQIWAKMEALRKIVGYSVARSTTYSQELKALYMFTGVELPTSMLENENQDIAHVSERLCFLMSVIGIK